MDIKLDINELLKDDKILIKALGIIIVIFIIVILAFIFITPGIIALSLDQRKQLITLGFPKIIFFSAALSIPLNLLGAITYLHPYKTLMEIPKKPIQSLIGVIFGSCLWGIFSGCIIYFIVHKYGAWLSKVVSEDILMQYIAVYFGLLSFFGIYFYISSTCFFKKIGSDK